MHGPEENYVQVSPDEDDLHLDKSPDAQGAVFAEDVLVMVGGKALEHECFCECCGKTL